MKKIRRAPAWALIFLAALRVGVALSCQCQQPPPPSEILKNHAVVFVGKVMRGEFLGATPTDKAYGRKFTFKVSETLKGTVPETVEIGTGAGGGDCGYDFVIGREYLVYANYGKEQDSSSLFTSICDYTKEYLPEGRQEVEQLKANSAPTQSR